MSDGPKYSSKADILSRVKRRYLDVPIPETGDVLMIQSLTDKERSAFLQPTRKASNPAEIEARLEDQDRRLVRAVVVDPTDKSPMFGALDTIAMQEMDAAIVSRVSAAAWRHCGLNGNAVEEKSKNSEAAPVPEQQAS